MQQGPSLLSLALGVPYFPLEICFYRILKYTPNSEANLFTPLQGFPHSGNSK